MSKLILLLPMLLALTFPSGPTATYRYDVAVVLNDLEVTPGVSRTTQLHNATKTGICDGEGTKGFRKTTPKMKAQAYAEYGVDKDTVDRETFCKFGVTCDANPKPPFYEIDHVESIEIGGADDVKNLFPQPYFAHPGAHEKDKLENKLAKMICAGEISPELAQEKIASDWYALYRQMFVEHPVDIEVEPIPAVERARK